MNKICNIAVLMILLFPMFLKGNSGVLEIDDSVVGNESIILELIDMSDRYHELDNDLALLALKQAADIELNDVTNKTQYLYYFKLGELYLLTDNNESAIDNLKRALKIGEQFQDVESDNQVLLLLGIAYHNMGDKTRSGVYLNSSIAEINDESDSIVMLISLHFLGKNAILSGNEELAKEKFYSSLQLADYLQNHEYFIKNRIQLHKLNYTVADKDIITELRDNIAYASKYNYKSIPLAYEAIAGYYESTGNSDSASKYLLKKANAEMAMISARIKSLNELFEARQYRHKAKNKSNYTINILMVIFSMLIVVAIILIMIRYQKHRNQFQKNIQKAAKEIQSFNTLTEDFDNKVEEGSKLRINQLEEDIDEARKNLIALKNSKNKLIEVNQYKDKFMSKISHEIRTPLSTILGFAEILEDQLALKEQDELFAFARNISESGKNLILLLNNILDISKLNAHDVEINKAEYDIIELTNKVIDVYTPVAEVKGLKIISDFKDCPAIFSDKSMFNRILTNILDNAVKFTETGYIKISVNYDQNEKYHQLLIKDTGIGIDHTYINSVFEPYRQESLGYSASMQGAGLGLPLAKKMTELLNGTIELESVKGNGTTIKLKFNYELQGDLNVALAKKVTREGLEANSKSDDIIENKEELPWEQLSILVVEDDTTNQILFSKMLKHAQELVIAKDGKTAFSILEKRKRDFDIVLMDINLPGDWDGIELQKEIRKRYEQYKSVPFIAQTAYAISGNREKMIKEGFDEYITKPISKSSLIKAISQFQIKCISHKGDVFPFSEQ